MCKQQEEDNVTGKVEDKFLPKKAECSAYGIFPNLSCLDKIRTGSCPVHITVIKLVTEDDLEGVRRKLLSCPKYTGAMPLGLPLEEYMKDIFNILLGPPTSGPGIQNPVPREVQKVLSFPGCKI